MPPIRSESRQKLAEQEGKILLALSDIQSDRVKSLRAAAKLYDIPYTTLHARVYSLSLRVDIRLSGYKLIQYEEDSFAEWIVSMDICGAVPRFSTVREIANILLAACGKISAATVEKNWFFAFIQRHNKFRIYFYRRYNHQRIFNEDPKTKRQ